MGWTISFDPRVERDLRRLDREMRERVLAFFEQRIAGAEDPRRIGKALSGRFSGLWRYRIGDVHAICSIEDSRLIVVVIEVGHRREVYR